MDHRRVHRAGRASVQERRRRRKFRSLHADRRFRWQRGQHVLGADDRLATDAKLVPYRVELRLENMILLAQFHHPLLQHHVVEATLLTGPLGRLVVAPAAIPVAVVLFVVGDELALLAL